jgi:hypothetical protein
LIEVNEHRVNALKTFGAFVEASKGDEAIRNAVLLETTRSILAIQPNGYLEAGSESGEAVSRVIEVVKTTTGKPDKS